MSLVMEKFCDFLTLRPSGLITTLTKVLMDNFCPCFFTAKKNYRYLITLIAIETGCMVFFLSN